MAWPSTDVDDFGQFQIQSTLANGQQVRNTFSFWGHDSATGLSVGTLLAFLSSAYMDSVVTAYRALITAGATLEGVLARQVHDPVHPTDSKNEAFRVVGLAGTAAGAGDAPTETCSVLHVGTDSAVRSAHGRVFLPWSYDKSGFNGEKWTTGVQALFAAFATAMNPLLYTAGGGHASGGAADIDLAVYSPTLRLRSPGDVFAFRATALQARNRVHWLKSRSPRG